MDGLTCRSRGISLSVGLRTVDDMPVLRSSCVVCGQPRAAVCEPCWRRLPPAPSTRVRGVGPVPALFAYEGTGATVVGALKFRDGRRVVTRVADAIADRVLDEVRTDDLVCTWLPTSPARRRERGFDQSELLARAVGRRLGCGTERLLRRAPGGAQTGRTRSQRADNVSFTCHPRRGGGIRRLLVLDDVCTTGATIRAADAALRTLAIDDLRFFCAARTP